MEILKDKKYKEYNYISRYTPFPTYYNILDNKYMQGLTSQLDTNVAYKLHKVKVGDTLDSIAMDNYGNSTFY